VGIAEVLRLDADRPGDAELAEPQPLHRLPGCQYVDTAKAICSGVANLGQTRPRAAAARRTSWAGWPSSTCTRTRCCTSSRSRSGLPRAT
jgi:hypothetical protein